MSRYSARGRRYQTWLRPLVLARDRNCHWCGRPLDHTAPPRSRWAPSVDHLVPVSLGGDPLDPTNAVGAHYGCNSKRGNSTTTRRTTPRTTPSRRW
jgi:5-methylcytosine-specific restriction endonuclease McrA